MILCIITRYFMNIVGKREFGELNLCRPRCFAFDMHCMDKLGLKDVLDYVRLHCPDKACVGKFTNQITLF